MVKKLPVSIKVQEILSQFGITHEISIPLKRLKVYTYKTIKRLKEMKKFSCTLCPKTYVSNEGLKYHMNTHTGDKPYKCPYCSYTAAYSSNLHRHIKVAQHTTIPQTNSDQKLKYNPPKKSFKCSQCSHTTTCSQYLQRHVQRRHDRVKLHKCELCAYSSVTNAELKIHIRSHTGEKSHACAFCSYKCSTMAFLNLHMRTHTGEKPYKCSQCKYRATTSSVLQTHVTTWHLDTKSKTLEAPSLKCPKCDYCTANKSLLTAHAWIHREDKRFMCNLCNYKTNSISTLNLHKRKHTGEKPFKCTLCEFRSASKERLNLHIRIHTGEKPYSCEHCHFRALFPSALKKHNKIHDHRNKPNHTCQICSKSFAIQSKLYAHILLHTGEKPHSCEFCGKRFRASGKRNSHTKICKLNPKQSDKDWIEAQKCFKCTFCAYSTRVKGCLEDHSRTHTGEKPYNCRFCPSKFSCSSGKRNHERICPFKT